MKPSEAYLGTPRRPWHFAALIVATLILTFLWSAAAIAQGAGYWHTSGNQILDSNGQVVRIAGLNWYGFETTDEIIHGLWAQDYHTILNEIKNQGYNTIRMPFSNQMVETPEVPTNFTQTVNGQAVNTDLVGLNAMQVMDKIITAAGAAGLKVILDNHRSEAGNSNEPNGLWYTSQFPTSNWMNDWETLATRYKSFTDAAGNPIVIGMDLRNEPHVLANGARTGACWTGDTETGGCPTTNTAQNWPVAATAAGNAILAVNPNLLIFVEGNDCYGTDCGWQGGNLEGVATNPITLNVPNQLVYSAHDYGPDLFQQPWFNSNTTFDSLSSTWTKFWNYVSTQNIAPVWIGEFGDTNNAADIQSATPGSEGQWFSSLVSFLGNWPNLSWTYWAANGEDSFALLANQYDGIASAQKQSMLATIQFPLSLGGTPDFSLSASPASLSIPQNANGSSTITVTPTGGFSSSVTLTISGLPTGVTASFGANPTATGTVLTFVTQGNAGTGPAIITITGTSGSLTHTTTIALTIGTVNPNFSLSASPDSLVVFQGASGSTTITVTPSGGFTGPVNLSVSGLPTGVTATFGSNPITSSTVLTLAASSSAATGPANITITGNGGSLTQTTTIALTVSSARPTFILQASPASLMITQGSSGSSMINVSLTPGGSSGFTGTVTLSAGGLPAGVTANFNPQSITALAPSTLTLTASNAATLGPATVTITGTNGAETHTVDIALTVGQIIDVPDFSLSVNPTSLTVFPPPDGACGGTMITVTPINGFTGAVALTVPNLPAGINATFSPPTTTTTSTLTVCASSNATPGPFTLTITATSGALTHAVSVPGTVVVDNFFSLSAIPATLSIAQGATGTSTITVAPTGSFTGPVALSASGLPTGVTAMFSPPSTTGTSTLTLTASSTAALGAANVTITGTNGTITASTTVALVVTCSCIPDFTLAASPASLTVAQGASGTSTITVTSTGGFMGQVSLIASGLPAGVTAMFSPPSTTGTSTLTLVASSSAATGATTIVVSGVGGSLTRSLAVPLTVTSANPNVTITPVINANSPYYVEEDLKVTNTAPITALSITIIVAQTTGIGINGEYNTVGGIIAQSNSSASGTITYMFTLSPGQMLSPGSYLFAAQMNGTGTAHPTSGDMFSVAYIAGGTTVTQTGHF